MTGVRIAAVIPARMASSRFQGKPLLKVAGLPMVEHVRRRALLCRGFSEVIVATCDEEIAEAVRGYGGRCLMTSAAHPGGTDRVAEAARQLDCTHVVNVQGDEILIVPSDLEKMVRAIEAEPSIPAWNATARIERLEELGDPSVVKAAVSVSGRILYCARDFTALAARGAEAAAGLRAILGVLGYRRDFLERYGRLARTPLEVAESIDQSRIIEHDVMLRAVAFSHGYPGINEPRDVERVLSCLREDAVQRALLRETTGAPRQAGEMAPAAPAWPAAADAAPSVQRLAGALGTVRRLCPGLPVLAIRWMHVKHPLHPAQEALLLAAGETAQIAEEGTREALRRARPAFLLRRFGQCVGYALYLSARLAHLRLVSWRALAELRRLTFPVIARTWCFERERPADGTDFYYGDLQHRLARRGLRMLLLCGNVSGRGWAAFARGQSAVATTSRLAELCLVAPLAPLRMMVEQFRACLRLRRLAAQAPDPLLRRVSLWASQDCLAPDTALTSLEFWVARAAVRTWRPRAVVTLYEGHAWEQCFRRGVKVADPSCRTIGYQHTVVFRESLSLRRPAEDLAARSLPDVALCLGETPLELLRAGHEPYRTRLIPFGSFRYRTAPVARPAESARRTVLVAPEGYVSETRMLFAFASACARKLSSHTFVLRCHPELPMARALLLLGADLANQPNIVLSEGRPLEEDFARASVLLYRGSSTVLYAILHGLLPVYLLVEGARDRDPLSALEPWRERCASPDEFSALLERHERTPPGGPADAAWAAAVQYVQGYTGAVDDGRLEAFLEAAGLGAASAGAAGPDGT